jgi:uncharacterized protein YrzB (UPF0473 family)
MEREAETFIVTDENGKEITCEIIMTFDSDEFNKSYVVYQIVGDESGEYFAASFNPDDGDEGKLGQIETDAEWDFVEEVLESFLEDQEDEEDHDHNHDHHHHHHGEE